VSTGAIVTMAVVLGLVWGGFALCLVALARSREATEETSEDERAS